MLAVTNPRFKALTEKRILSSQRDNRVQLFALIKIYVMKNCFIKKKKNKIQHVEIMCKRVCMVC